MRFYVRKMFMVGMPIATFVAPMPWAAIACGLFCAFAGIDLAATIVLNNNRLPKWER